MIGVDGLDGSLVEAYADRGGVDRLLELFSRGAVFPMRRPPGEPPEVWTTIATGVEPEVHGVRSAGATRLPGVASPIAARSAPIAAGPRYGRSPVAHGSGVGRGPARQERCGRSPDS